MFNQFEISGFKCFSGQKFELRDLTVLTGSNGTGKSSLIQALLLARLAIEKNALNQNEQNYTTTAFRECPVPLNKGYQLSLGTAGDIFNEGGLTDNGITLKLDEDIFTAPLPEMLNGTSLPIKINLKDAKQEDVPFWRRRAFYYLNAERLGPRHSLASNFTDFVHCGYSGEFAAQVLLNNAFDKVEEVRKFEGSKSDFLRQQVDTWLDYVCPGTAVTAEPLGTMNAQVRLRNSAVRNPILATNIGFGISYSLPIIINGLVAQQGCVLIVENPEAHLHPKGQSNIGYFLAKVAASGVKVIVETHSEHVVNGMRRGYVTNSQMDTSRMAIYFFNSPDAAEKFTLIDTQPNGDLSAFPVDFFDQARQDLLTIVKASMPKQ